MAILSLYIWWIVATAVILVGSWALWRWRFDFHYFDFWFGAKKLRKLAKDSGHDKGADWSDSEKTLCGEYSKFIHYPDQVEFERCGDYLHLAQDGGRTTLPAWMLILLIVLVVAESMGFSYMLGTYLALEGSENLHLLLMVGIVLVFAVLMPLVTHEAGHELYRTNLIGRNTKKRGARRGEGGAIVDVQLKNPQEIDKEQPPYTRCLNRVGEDGGYFKVYFAVILIVLIAGISTWMRMSHLEKVQTQETLGISSTQQSSNPYASGNPSELTDPQKTANAKGGGDTKNAADQEGLAAFIMLAVLFVVTQAVGIGAGFKFGFAGKYSKDAYEGTRGFSSYRQVREFYKPRIKIANDRLKNLQQKMRQNGADHDLPLNKKFEDYLALDEDSSGNYNPVRPEVSVSSPATAAPAATQSSGTPQIEVKANEPAQISQPAGMPANSSQQQSKFCKECGSAIVANAKFCGGCGLSLT